MAHICEVCGKGIMSGNNVSHSNRHTKAAWKPNVQMSAPVACVPAKLPAHNQK